MADVVIVEAVRTAIGKKNGTLAHTHPIDILGPVLSEVLRRADVEPAQVGQVLGGCIDQVGAQSGNITRTAWLGAGLPVATACQTINTACGSSQQALGLAYSLVASGVEDVAVACGVENMSMVPLGSDAYDTEPSGWSPSGGFARPSTGRFEGQILPIQANQVDAAGKRVDELGADPARVNPNGGAIALGHPLGGTGCILTTKALHELERADQEIGLITMCCGGGLGTGTLIQRLP